MNIIEEYDKHIEKLEAENKKYKTAIMKAIKDIETAENGEGYQFNIPFILSDLKKSVNKDYLPNPPFMLSDLKQALKE